MRQRAIKVGDSPAGVECIVYQRGNESDARFSARCGRCASHLRRAHRRIRVRAMLRRVAARRASCRVNVTRRQAEMISDAYEYVEDPSLAPITQRATYVIHTRDGWLDCMQRLHDRAQDDDDCQASSVVFDSYESEPAIQSRTSFAVRALQNSRESLYKKIEKSLRKHSRTR